MLYNGLKGYLATITSATENDFIWTRIDGIGWIGAPDEQTEDVWKWVTGPAAEQVQFWQGTYNNGVAWKVIRSCNFLQLPSLNGA